MNLKALFATGSLILEGVVFAQEEVGVDGRAVSADVEELEDVVLGKKEMLPSSGFMRGIGFQALSELKVYFEVWAKKLKEDSPPMTMTLKYNDGLNNTLVYSGDEDVIAKWDSNEENGKLKYFEIRVQSQAVGDYLIDEVTFDKFGSFTTLFEWGRKDEIAWCISNDPKGWEKYTYDCNCWLTWCDKCPNVSSKICHKGYRFILGIEQPVPLD